MEFSTKRSCNEIWEGMGNLAQGLSAGFKVSSELLEQVSSTIETIGFKVQNAVLAHYEA